MVNDFPHVFGTDGELFFIWDFVEFPRVLVLEMSLLSDFAFDFARHPGGIIGLGPLFPLINYLRNSSIK